MLNGTVTQLFYKGIGCQEQHGMPIKFYMDAVGSAIKRDVRRKSSDAEICDYMLDKLERLYHGLHREFDDRIITEADIRAFWGDQYNVNHSIWFTAIATLLKLGRLKTDNMTGFHIVRVADYTVHVGEGRYGMPEPTHTCRKCGERFTSEYRLRVHKRRAHPKISLSTESLVAIERALARIRAVQECFPDHTQPSAVEDEIRACACDVKLPASFRGACVSGAWGARAGDRR